MKNPSFVFREIAALEKQFIEGGGSSESIGAARLAHRTEKEQEVHRIFDF